jgi:hypothetical protein
VFKRYFPTAAAFAAAALLSSGCGPVEEMETDTLGTREDGLTSAQFWHDLRAYSGTSGQCNSGVNITEGAFLGNWTSRMRIDTDSRAGGCYQKFSIYDPAGELSGLQLSVDFHGQANLSGYGQCDFPGVYSIPVGTAVSWSSVYGIDTNSDPGGCVQAFSLAGRSDVAFDIKYEDDGFNGQCDKTGVHTVTAASSKSIVFDMDDRGGGCFVSYRLRKIACGDAVCDPGESCIADCDICGDGVCSPHEQAYGTCQDDCTTCGDGYCGSNESCASDCGPECGNGICEIGESQFSCSIDCGGGTGCGMRICPEDPI